MHYVPKPDGSDEIWATKTIFANWKARTRIITPGDVTGDGKADFLARTAAGTLYLYPGTGKGTSEIFGMPKVVGTDYKQFDIIG